MSIFHLLLDAVTEAGLDGSVPESVRDEEEEILEEQKDDGKMGLCEIQWQQKKFSKKNFKRLDDAKKFNLSISKIEEEKIDDKVQIIRLSEPMKVRSPLGYRSSYNLSIENQAPNVSSNTLSVQPRPHPPVSREVATSHKESQTMTTSQENLRKPSILSLRSLSLSLRMIMPLRGHREEEHNELKTIEESKMANFKDSEFQSYSKYSQGTTKTRKFTIFKNQKIYDRRSSMSDIPDDPNASHQRTLHMQNASGASTSASNVKHEHPPKKHVDHHKDRKSQDKEALKEIRRRQIEQAKRIQTAPRRISTAY